MAKHYAHTRWRKVGTNGRVAETYQEFIERRFWGKVEKSEGCWLWKAGVRRKDEGYGQFYLRGKPIAAHRVALMLSGYQLSDGDVVAHHCDNPPCVRPDHLFVTTNAGNTADRHSKGRTASHELNGNAKLTDRQVSDLREDSRRGMRVSDLAEKYGVSRTHVWRLTRYKMRT
ncbi:HNH endonuclease [Nitrospira sp. BLG_2]|uniref:HNH endonuclease n=1 Tax=Nitrospira sp. BLG_2 TaxID=3397507 RepID=UPI003B9A8468